MDVRPIGKFEGEYFWLSNFYEHPVTFILPDGNPLSFPTNEHAFQALKYKAMKGSDEDKVDYVHKVAQAPTPAKAKYHGRSVNIDLDVWDALKVGIMRHVCKAKFDDSELQAKLLATGAGMLVEGNTWGDVFWGRVDGKGKNVLGSILMELRGHYFWRQ